RYPNDPLFKVQEETVLIHEMGHVFGAIHAEDSDSIMSPIVDRQIPTGFDNINADIIMLTRDIDFSKGIKTLDPKTSQQLLSSYIRLMNMNQPVEFYYNLGIFYLNLGKAEDTVQAWQKAAALDPKDPQIQMDLGILYLKVGDYKKAVKYLSHSVSLLSSPLQKPKRAEALKNLGDAYLQDGALMPAYNALSRALAIAPDDLDTKLNLAIVQLKQGRKTDAVKDFEKLLQKNPDNAKVLKFLGTAHFELGQLDKAYDYYTRALGALSKKRESPNVREEISEIYNQLGTLYMKTDRVDDALNAYKNACSAVDSVDCHRRLGDLYFKRGNWDGVLQELTRVVKVRKDDADLYGKLGVAMSQLGNSEQALAFFREGLRYTRDDKVRSRFYTNAGYICLQMEHPDLAEKEFGFAIAHDYQNVDAQLGMASASIQRSDLETARDYLQTVLKMDPKNERARNLLASVSKTIEETPQKLKERYGL
ncbi:MAG: tetratricopeptide repeat protein, partial [Candidatus Omnitrophica bacterium]|nr:tetratricopeptide repeat protein [Candidatus Omnitrophota bacterium]